MTRSSIGGVEDGQDQEVTNEAAAALFQTPINTPGDALHLLLKASGQSEEIQRREFSDQNGTRRSQRKQQHAVATDGIAPIEPNIQQQSRFSGYTANLDPAIAQNRHHHGLLSPPKEALQIWSRLRFVRAGWFTAREAMSYID